MQRFLVSYDISDDKNRTKVFKRLKKLGEHLQKSVFIVDLTDLQRRRLEEYIKELLKDNDSLFILPCCARCYSLSSYIGAPKEVVLIA